jgi:hypothetical protein
VQEQPRQEVALPICALHPAAAQDYYTVNRPNLPSSLPDKL